MRRTKDLVCLHRRKRRTRAEQIYLHMTECVFLVRMTIVSIFICYILKRIHWCLNQYSQEEEKNDIRSIIYYYYLLLLFFLNSGWFLINGKIKICGSSKIIITWHIHISILHIHDYMIPFLQNVRYTVKTGVKNFSRGMILTTWDVCHQRTATKLSFTYLKRTKIHC